MQTSTPELPNLLTTQEVASYMKFSSSYIRRLARRGELPSVTTEGGGRHRRFLEPDIMEYLRKRRSGGSVKTS